MTNALKTSFATVASPVVLTAADLNGTGALSTGHIVGLPRVVTISRSNAAAQYTTSPIVVMGRYGGKDVSESLTPANANGNDTLRTTQAFEQITEIDIPAQAATGGAFTIGVEDIVAPKGDTFIGVELAAAGNINCQYGEGSGANTDSIPIATAQVGVVKSIAPTRIRTNASLANPTTVGLTVYLP